MRMARILSPIILLLLAAPFAVAGMETPPGMILIEGGSFTMGAETERGDYPAHAVTVSAFYLDTHELTCAQYMCFCRETDRPFPFFWEKEGFRVGPDFPDHPKQYSMKYKCGQKSHLPYDEDLKYTICTIISPL